MTYPWLEAVAAEFRERLQGGRLPHALLLSGPAETGKRDIAAEFVATLLCQDGAHPACGRCRSCQLLSSGAHPDRYVVTFGENPKTGELRKEIVIDQIRRLIASLHLTNTVSERKAALIHPAEALNRPSSNALLKTLEEPPGNAVLILVTDAPSRLSATIRSRCQNLHVRPPERRLALDWLCHRAGGEQGDADLALDAAAGSPLRALRMLSDGSTDQYRMVNTTLDQLLNGRIGCSKALEALSAIDPQLLWFWISLRTAALLRNGKGSRSAAKLLSRLQTAADWNRKETGSPLRKDLLLQDWLIQWSGLRPQD